MSVPPQVINVICPSCGKTWMTPDIESTDYFCCACGYTLTKEQAKKAAWRSKSIYYGE